MKRCWQKSGAQHFEPFRPAAHVDVFGFGGKKFVEPE
tara:strand:+ start:17058 stop:17168 length:111 start_codon:yes stop_codon:yes gene_type:complete